MSCRRAAGAAAGKPACASILVRSARVYAGSRASLPRWPVRGNSSNKPARPRRRAEYSLRQVSGISESAWLTRPRHDMWVHRSTPPSRRPRAGAARAWVLADRVRAVPIIPSRQREKPPGSAGFEPDESSGDSRGQRSAGHRSAVRHGREAVPTEPTRVPCPRASARGPSTRYVGPRLRRAPGGPEGPPLRTVWHGLCQNPTIRLTLNVRGTAGCT